MNREPSAKQVSGAAAERCKRKETHQQSKPVQEDWEPGKKPWWAGLFVRAGRMGSIRQELRAGEHHGKKKINVTGFKEQDQENLYEQVGRASGKGSRGGT